jgi:flagellar protein FliS
MNTTSVIKTYAKVGIESGVSAADPHKLISMLYQGALLAVANAKNSILKKNIPARGSAISKAIAIIDEGLNASLDKSVGGELVQNLSSLYKYMSMRLLTANLKNDMDALDEVARLLNDLKDAWESIRQPNAVAATSTNMQKTSQKLLRPEGAGLAMPAETQPTTGLESAPAQQNAVNKKIQLAYGRGK